MKYAIDDIKSYYLRISQAYIKIAIVFNAAGQWEESMQLTKEYKDYFDKNMPEKFTIKFAGKFDYDAAANSGNLGNLKIIEGDLLINKNNLLWGEKRMDQAAFECVSRLSLQNVTDQFNSAEFRNKIIKFAETNITDAAEIKEYKIEPKVERIYFTESEYSDSINPKKIFDADERICIKVVLDTYNRFYQRPIEITLKSSVSGRNKIVKTTPRRGSDLPYALFQPNETQEISDSTKNLIETDLRQINLRSLKDPKDEKLNLINNEKNGKDLRISYFRGYENSKDCFYLYNSSYFKYKLVRSDYDDSLVSVQNNIIKNLFNFVKTGGAEYINIKHGDLSLYALIKNQADWFIIDGDGPIENPIITSSDGVNVQPIRFFKEYEGHEEDVYNDKWLSKYKNPSFIDGVQVLILDACYSLKWPRHVKQWHKVLPDGLIMGYSNKISPWMTDTAFVYLKKKIDSIKDDKLSKKELGDMWLNLHDGISDYFLCYSAIYAVYILEKKMWYIEYEPSFFYEYKKVLKAMPIRY